MIKFNEQLVKPYMCILKNRWLKAALFFDEKIVEQ